MKHIVPLLEGGLILISLEFFLFRPQWLFYVIGAISLFIVLGILIPQKRFFGGKEFWHFLTNPLIFVWSAIVLLLFFENVYFKHFFVLGIGIYVSFYFENLFFYSIFGREKAESNFLRMTNMMNVISIFFLAAGFYGIKTFVQLPFWILAIIFFVFSIGLIYTSMWIVRQNFKEIYMEAFILALITMELFLAINFLPLSFYVGGAIIGIIYYAASGILVNYLKNKEIVYKRYVITAPVLLLLVLLTARWV